MTARPGVDVVEGSVPGPRGDHHHDHAEPPASVMGAARRFLEDDGMLEHRKVMNDDSPGPDDAVRIPREALDLERRPHRGELPQRI